MVQERAIGSSGLVGRLLILALAIGLLAAAEVWRSYQQALETAERVAESLASLLAEQVERSIQTIDLTLIGLKDALRLAPGLPPHDAGFRRTMQHRVGGLPYVRRLFVAGADGNVVHDTRYPDVPGSSVADRLYFKVHEESDIRIHIGHPLMSRHAGVWFVSFSRRITKADGSFGGVVVASVEPRYFEAFYEKLAIGTGNVIAVILREGPVLVRTPDHGGTIGRSYADSAVRKMAHVREAGVAWMRSPVDGVKRLIGFRTVASGSVIVFIGLAESSVFGASRVYAGFVAGGALLVWALAAGLAIASHNYRRRTERAQAQMARSQRLETMGRIAGGIAHDLGNTIKVARTTFTLLKPSLAGQADAMALVEGADRSLGSAFEIIDRLLTLARRQELSPRPSDLAELIEEFVPILHQATGPRIELSLELAKGLVCAIDPVHLESALLNLVLNAKDAIPDSGRIAIELREVQPPRRRYRMPRWAASARRPWAEIAVRDDGVGMPRDVLERAFEPFFTTGSHGSGLGLSQVLGFVEQSSGKVAIESREGRGTTVRLCFPTLLPTAGQ